MERKSVRPRQLRATGRWARPSMESSNSADLGVPGVSVVALLVESEAGQKDDRAPCVCARREREACAQHDYIHLAVLHTPPCCRLHRLSLLAARPSRTTSPVSADERREF